MSGSWLGSVHGTWSFFSRSGSPPESRAPAPCRRARPARPPGTGWPTSPSTSATSSIFFRSGCRTNLLVVASHSTRPLPRTPTGRRLWPLIGQSVLGGVFVEAESLLFSALVATVLFVAGLSAGSTSAAPPTQVHTWDAPAAARVDTVVPTRRYNVSCRPGILRATLCRTDNPRVSFTWTPMASSISSRLTAGPCAMR